MRILIDGYNLLFQSGLGGRARGPGWIQNARDQLLNLLHQQLSAKWSKCTFIVFDKSQDRQSQLDYHTSLGISVRFAVEHDEADDLIEELIRAHNSPKSLTVVSSDLRVRRQAIARRAESLDSEIFLRRLENGFYRDEMIDESTVDLTENKLSDSEVQFWLKEFGEGI